MFGPGGDAPGDVDNNVTLMLPQRPTMFQDSEVEMWDRLGVLETAVDNAVDHGYTPECAKMLCDIVFRTHLDVFRRALLGDPPARVESLAVRLQLGARVMRANSHQNVTAYREMRQSCRDCRSVAKAIGDEVAWEGLEEAASTWEPVSHVLQYALAVLRKAL